MSRLSKEGSIPCEKPKAHRSFLGMIRMRRPQQADYAEELTSEPIDDPKAVEDVKENHNCGRTFVQEADAIHPSAHPTPKRRSSTKPTPSRKATTDSTTSRGRRQLWRRPVEDATYEARVAYWRARSSRSSVREGRSEFIPGDGAPRRRRFGFPSALERMWRPAIQELESDYETDGEDNDGDRDTDGDRRSVSHASVSSDGGIKEYLFYCLCLPSFHGRSYRTG
ncbi:hypothetical protein CONPUDRAFT_144410 [Coniophora puteana RWD-64-598 SS2]|uniref:Uncharacterized protein n=1 Tax=Coniophora puteana (strain RWD-64-598) TaxID=741705 RepID=A0A5M3MM08_CONPW|nr:uncharacterized protein CONPUDRAFT_144410 [Coniophora puteana RWD-64-598 SS2]EIW80239.1 hypothetical protein CONPUDRAFT_144410 [Coniophora puteana RWD-64-598 SS2]